jgi:hypothetical protein
MAWPSLAYPRPGLAWPWSYPCLCPWAGLACPGPGSGSGPSPGPGLGPFHATAAGLAWPGLAWPTLGLAWPGLALPLFLALALALAMKQTFQGFHLETFRVCYRCSR